MKQLKLTAAILILSFNIKAQGPTPDTSKNLPAPKVKAAGLHPTNEVHTDEYGNVFPISKSKSGRPFIVIVTKRGKIKIKYLDKTIN